MFEYTFAGKTYSIQLLEEGDNERVSVSVDGAVIMSYPGNGQTRYAHFFEKGGGVYAFTCSEEYEGHALVDFTNGIVTPFVEPGAEDGHGFIWLAPKVVAPNLLAVLGTFWGGGGEFWILYDIRNPLLPRPIPSPVLLEMDYDNSILTVEPVDGGYRVKVTDCSQEYEYFLDEDFRWLVPQWEVEDRFPVHDEFMRSKLAEIGVKNGYSLLEELDRDWPDLESGHPYRLEVYALLNTGETLYLKFVGDTVQLRKHAFFELHDGGQKLISSAPIVTGMGMMRDLWNAEVTKAGGFYKDRSAV